MKNCVLTDVCKNKDILCLKCKDYKKFIRKKSLAAQRRGRANKRAGKKSEKKLLNRLLNYDLKARIIAGSGAYKHFKKDADADLRVVVFSKERKIENKKRKDFSKIRKLVSESVLEIKGFCYILREDQFVALVKNKIMPETYLVDDKGFSYLHKFFEQDNADIVTLDESYKDFMFAVSKKLWKEAKEKCS